jgi:hypothetical protein
MLYFSGMTEDHVYWSGWVSTLREQRLHEPVAWLIKAGKPAAILLSQMVILASPLFSSSNVYQKLNMVAAVLEDGDQLDDFYRALHDDGVDA